MSAQCSLVCLTPKVQLQSAHQTGAVDRNLARSGRAHNLMPVALIAATDVRQAVEILALCARSVNAGCGMTRNRRGDAIDATRGTVGVESSRATEDRGKIVRAWTKADGIARAEALKR